MQNAMSIYLVTYEDCDKHELIVDSYSRIFEESKFAMEKIALQHLKQASGLNINDHMESPLFDTIKIEDISQGLTIRYHTDKSDDGKITKSSDRIIDMIKIEKVYDYGIIPNKKRSIIKTFKIIEVSPISESGSIRGEEYDDEQ